MRVMNCDQVFEVLTRGPFPTGTPCDAPVEAHLSECPECYRLAEALRPAVELFQEAVDPEESRDLPGYWSAASERPSAVSFASQVESRRAAGRKAASGTLTKLTKDWTAPTVWRMAAMLALGVILGTLFTARIEPDALRWSPFDRDAAGAPLAPPQTARLSIADRIELAALPAACYRSPRLPGTSDNVRGGQLSGGTEVPKVNCCSGCHNAAAEAVPGRATVEVAQSCQLCHHQRPLGREAPVR